MRFLALAVALAVSPSAASAQRPAPPAAWAPPTSFADRVRADVAARWHVDPTDVRLDWGPAPAAHAPTAASSATLLGSGAGGGWIVDVDGGRSRLAVRAGVLSRRAVAARDLARGDVLAAGDIALDTLTAWGEPAPDPTSAVMAGWVANRAVRAGEPLRPPAVAAPAVVRAGERVRVTYVVGAVQLALDAVAAGSAALGQPVAVRTPRGRRLQGVAAGDALVRIEATPGRTP